MMFFLSAPGLPPPPPPPPSSTLELVHKTTLDEIPYALAAFQGKVVIGVGRLLRLYDLGKKKLLRKSENKVGKQVYCR